MSHSIPANIKQDIVRNTRFEFFKEHGAPNTTTYKAALQKVEGFVNKLRINMNFYAFFFGPLYFFAKKMRKPGLTILGIAIVVWIIASFFPPSLQNALNLPLGILCGMIANYTYYRFVVLKEHDYNPFKGMKR